MFFSIIVSTCNRPHFLDLCLHSVQLAINNLSSIATEVIVTDDSDDNETQKMVHEKYPSYFYFRSVQKGPAANRNHGAEKANGTWLVFLDDDVVLKEDIFTTYLRLILSVNYQIFEGAIFANNPEMLKRDMSECPVNQNGNCFWSANICIKASIFKEVNGFDEQFTLPAQEDQDLHLRLKKLYPVFFVKDAIVFHPVRVISLRLKIRTIFKGVDNWYLFESKHNKQTVKRALKVCVDLIYAHLRGAYTNIKQLKPKSAFFSIFWLCSGFPYYLLLCSRKIYDKNELHG